MADKTNFEFDEAPASANVSIKSPNGAEWQFTIREETVSILIEKMMDLEHKFMELNYTFLPKYNSKFASQKPPVEYVPNRKCPKCGSLLVYSRKKNGDRFIKCSTNKYDFTTKTASGCTFIEWPQPLIPPDDIPSRDINNHEY